MGIQAFVPSGGGGTPGFDYIASVNMETYNRSWPQSGAAGNYIITSNVSNPGYAYFTNGSSTTGTPLNKVVTIAHSFTTINIIAPTGDFVSLYKAAVKSTTTFANPFANFASFPSIITSSGNFVLPTSALPLVTALVVGGGGGGGNGHAGGGGGGGNVVKLNGYLAVGTTSVTIGGRTGNGTNSGMAGTTYFGNVFAYGGGSGATHGAPGNVGGNGGAPGGHNPNVAAGGMTETSGTGGLGTQSGATLHGGFSSGRSGTGSGTWANKAGGGGGAGGAGGDAPASGGTPGSAGLGISDSITGSAAWYGHGGAGGGHDSPTTGSHHTSGGYGGGGGGNYSPSDNGWYQSVNGVVIVRYYIA